MATVQCQQFKGNDSMALIQLQQFNGDGSMGFNEELQPFVAGDGEGLFGLGQLGAVSVRPYHKGTGWTQ